MEEDFGYCLYTPLRKKQAGIKAIDKDGLRKYNIRCAIHEQLIDCR